MALLTLGRPDCYLLDEPSNDLDIDTLDWLETFIRECAQPVLFISHDELLLERTANVILHMEQLRRKTLPRWTVARMGYRQYVEERLQKFTHQEQLARKEREEERKQQERLPENPAKGGTPAEHHLPPRPPREPAAEKENEGGQVPGAPLRTGAGGHDGVPDSEEAILVALGRTRPSRGENRAGHHLARPVRRRSLPGAAAPGGEPAAVRPGRGTRVRHRPQRRGENHLPAAGGRGAAGRQDIRAAYMPQDYGETWTKARTPVEFLAKSWEKEELTRIKTYLGSMKYTPKSRSTPSRSSPAGKRPSCSF